MTDAAESKLKDWGLLVLRVGFGAIFIVIHGWPKITAGPEAWAKMGSAMGNLGVHFFPAFWGFMAAFSEFGGGIAIALGLFIRPMSLLLAFTMAVAATMHLSRGDGFGAASHALACGVVALSFMIMGAGKFSLGTLLFRGKKS